MKKVAILQSNYIPWKGYFDLIAFADHFILYDDVQFTKNDWRNRNLILTPRGREWLSIPVGSKIHRLIKDVDLPAGNWRDKHLAKLKSCYRKTPFYDEVTNLIGPIYASNVYETLSEFNRALIEQICCYLKITTAISWSWEFEKSEGRSERVLDICQQSGASTYVSGPAAKNYLDEQLFAKAGISVCWFDYSNYPVYSQAESNFENNVSILDLLYNCGKNSPRYMKHV
jgi:hypothetical protein